MLANTQGPARAILFYALALGLALILAVFFAAPLGEAITLATMVTPALAAVVMLVVFREGAAGWRSLGVGGAGLKGWWLAILGPLIVLALSYAILVALGLAALEVPALSRSAAETAFGLVLNLAVGLVLAFGEEVGWRGYMLPRLSQVGLVRAMLLVGLAQGVWHLPIILLTPFYHSGGNTLLVVVLFLVTLTLAGVFYGYLRVWTGSVWPVVIAHAVYNFAWNVGSEFVRAPSPTTMEYLGGESGVLVIVALAAVALVLARLLRSPPPQAGTFLASR